MPQEYTRQRQGRDFHSFNLNDCDAKAECEKKSLLAHLEACITESERANTPLDGHEPSGVQPEQGR
jgi:hypothetical protein